MAAHIWANGRAWHGAAAGAEQRLKELGITLPPPPTPFGAYVEAVRSGNLVFLSGMLPVVGHEPQFIGRVGGELTRRGRPEGCRNGLLERALGGESLSGIARQRDRSRQARCVHRHRGRFSGAPESCGWSVRNPSSRYSERRSYPVVSSLASRACLSAMPIELELVLEVKV